MKKKHQVRFVNIFKLQNYSISAHKEESKVDCNCDKIV